MKALPSKLTQILVSTVAPESNGALADATTSPENIVAIGNAKYDMAKLKKNIAAKKAQNKIQPFEEKHKDSEPLMGWSTIAFEGTVNYNKELDTDRLDRQLEGWQRTKDGRADYKFLLGNAGAELPRNLSRLGQGSLVLGYSPVIVGIDLLGHTLKSDVFLNGLEAFITGAEAASDVIGSAVEKANRFFDAPK